MSNQDIFHPRIKLIFLLTICHLVKLINHLNLIVWLDKSLIYKLI